MIDIKGQVQLYKSWVWVGLFLWCQRGTQPWSPSGLRPGPPAGLHTLVVLISDKLPPHECQHNNELIVDLKKQERNHQNLYDSLARCCCTFSSIFNNNDSTALLFIQKFKYDNITPIEWSRW